MGEARRRIFVGDVQGCREELEALLEECAFDPAADELHPVGDLVNRGPDSAGALRVFRSLPTGGVLGNHDLHLLRVRAGTRKLGRRDTLEELLQGDEADELCAWLAERPLLRAWDDLWLVHAGLHPRWEDPAAELDGLDPLQPHPALDFATRVRHCDAEGRTPERDDPPPPPPYAAWWAHRARARTVVFGHWAARGLVLEPGLRGLDTGCVWGGRLTAWIAEEDRLVSVPARRAYQALNGQAPG